MVKFERLFQPIVINGLHLKNRIVMAPMSSRLSTPKGEVTEAQIRYYRRRAQGGVGLIVVEYAYIDEKTSKSAMSQLGAYDDQLIPGLNELAEAIQSQGAKVSLQICHGGRQTLPARIGGKMPVSPSAIPCKFISGLIGKTNWCRELTIDEIQEIAQSFGQSALRAKIAGFDAVELHGAHGYLLESFISPYTNKRTDIYGGDIYGRSTFPLEVVREVRKVVGPSFPLFYRMSGSELLEGGLTLEEGKIFAHLLEENRVDCIHVSGTNFETINKQEPPLYIEPGNLLPLAAGIKSAVGIPVIAVGALHDPVFAEEVLKSGKADLIAMGRALLADPDLPQKAEAGDLDSIRPCIRCNDGCIGRFFLGRTQRCSVNFSTGQEGDPRLSRPRPSQSLKKMIVVGGGVAGMEAARIAATQGYEVTLFEKDKQLGGNLIAGSVPEFKKDLRKLLSYYSKTLKTLGVSVILGQAATPELIKKMAPYVLVVAAGSEVHRPDLPGIGLPHVMTSIDALMDEEKIKGEPIVVAGGGLVGCEISVYLALKGRKIILLEMLPEVASDLDAVSRLELLEMLKRDNITVLTGSQLIEIGKGEVKILRNGSLSLIDADAIILALSMRPRKEIFEQLAHLVPISLAVGDCVTPGKIGDAIHDAANKVLNLGGSPSW
jgi:2,4-dienoyl-CoA reductase-like NADH-dependent reductase (Old Yellow Enzyme family)/thioredoxin reductase